MPTVTNEKACFTADRKRSQSDWDRISPAHTETVTSPLIATDLKYDCAHAPHTDGAMNWIMNNNDKKTPMKTELYMLQ